MARVRLAVSFQALKEFLRLPEGAEITGTAFPSLAELLSLERPARVTLEAEFPDAPEGATWAHPEYSCRDGLIAMEGIWWYRKDGSLIAPEPAPEGQ